MAQVIVLDFAVGNANVFTYNEEAQKLGIQKLILYSNRQLKSALHLYESFGFKEIPVESGVYERADIKMELLLPQ